MKSLNVITVLLLALSVLLSSCNDASLQKYYVEKQNDNSFITVDLPGSLLITKDNTLTDEQLQTLKSIKKVNMLALQVDDTNKAVYELEKERVHQIIADEKYIPLIKYGSNKTGATLLFTGEEDAIDELIVFASDEERGFALFRVLGDEMDPSKIIRLMDSVNSNNFDLSFMKEFATVLD